MGQLRKSPRRILRGCRYRKANPRGAWWAGSSQGACPAAPSSAAVTPLPRGQRLPTSRRRRRGRAPRGPGAARQAKEGWSAALASRQAPGEAAPRLPRPGSSPGALRPGAGLGPAALRLPHLPRPFGGRGGAHHFPGASCCLPLARESQQQARGGAKPEPLAQQPAWEPAKGKVRARGSCREGVGFTRRPKSRPGAAWSAAQEAFGEGSSGSGGKEEAVSRRGCIKGREEARGLEAEGSGISSKSWCSPSDRACWCYKGDWG